MENLSLNETIKNIYDNRVSYLRSKNIELEREEFSKNQIPLGEIMQGLSYDEHFYDYKRAVKDIPDYEIEQMFTVLQDYFLFSYGHDLMFKNKLKADLFNSVPIDNLIYPRLENAVKTRFNDISVMRENPNFEFNVTEINRLAYVHTEAQGLIYLLYCFDFQFPQGWEGFCPDIKDEVLEILNTMTIGEFLHALIDFKCQTMTDIFKEISDPKLREKYLNKVEKLKQEKHEETKTFGHVHLPITFFLDHSLLDMLDTKPKSPILLSDSEDTTGSKKIIIYK